MLKTLIEYLSPSICTFLRKLTRKKRIQIQWISHAISIVLWRNNIGFENLITKGIVCTGLNICIQCTIYGIFIATIRDAKRTRKMITIRRKIDYHGMTIRAFKNPIYRNRGMRMKYNMHSKSPTDPKIGHHYQIHPKVQPPNQILNLHSSWYSKLAPVLNTPCFQTTHLKGIKKITLQNYHMKFHLSNKRF